MDKRLEILINKSLTYLESGEAFLSKNVPIYIEEILKFQMYEEGVDALWAMPLLLLAAALFYFIFIRKNKEGVIGLNTWDEGDVVGAIIFGVLLPFLIGTILLISNLLDIIQIHVAPRMYLIEYFKDLK